MSQGSRIPGFYRLPLAARREEIARRSGSDLNELIRAVEMGGLDPTAADKVVENVLGVYGLPFGVALNVEINGRDRLVPMVVEEPSVIAAASNAARMVRASGGFHASMLESLMTGQIELFDVANETVAVAALEAHWHELLELARGAVPSLVARGGGPRSMDVRRLGDGYIVIHVYVDCGNAMGANLVNTIAEAVGPRAAQIANAKLGLRILSNLCDKRRVLVRCRVHPEELLKARGENNGGTEGDSTPPVSDSSSGASVVDSIVRASRFASLDPYRAATHNKGIMNGIDAVVLATGNDFRAVEAGAHAFAAHTGRYSPLATWRRDGADLVGELEVPLALGTVGGTLRIHPTAKIALAVAQVTSADDLAMLAASIGLA
jgi:hydroxymethylglutaryl-CoA reductase